MNFLIHIIVKLSPLTIYVVSADPVMAPVVIRRGDLVIHVNDISMLASTISALDERRSHHASDHDIVDAALRVQRALSAHYHRSFSTLAAAMACTRRHLPRRLVRKLEGLNKAASFVRHEGCMDVLLEDLHRFLNGEDDVPSTCVGDDDNDDDDDHDTTAFNMDFNHTSAGSVDSVCASEHGCSAGNSTSICERAPSLSTATELFDIFDNKAEVGSQTCNLTLGIVVPKNERGIQTDVYRGPRRAKVNGRAVQCDLGSQPCNEQDFESLVNTISSFTEAVQLYTSSPTVFPVPVHCSRVTVLPDVDALPGLVPEAVDGSTQDNLGPYEHELTFIKNHWRNEFIRDCLPPLVADLITALEVLKADLFEKEHRIVELSSVQHVTDSDFLAMQARLALLEADFSSRHLAR